MFILEKMTCEAPDPESVFFSGSVVYATPGGLCAACEPVTTEKDGVTREA